MKRLLTMIAVLGLVACATGVARASSPVLYNGDLNLITLADTPGNPPVGWTALGYQSVSFPPPLGGWTDCEASEPWCNGAADPSPTGYGVFFKPFEGSTNSNPALDNLASCLFYQDNPSSPNTTYTLSAYACGQANYSGYQTTVLNNGVAPATGLYVVFFDSSGGVLQSNSYDIVAAGLSNLGDPVPSVQFTTPVYTAPAGTVTVRAGGYMLNVWGTAGAQSLTMDDFDLEATAPPGSPVVTSQPSALTVGLGGTAHFTVGTTPTATTNAWLFNNNTVTDVAGHISGSSTATLTITGVTTNDVGHYQAVVSNSSGLNRSAIVPLAISTIYIFPTVSINGTIGDTYKVYSSLNVSGPYTNLVATVKLATSPQYIPDQTVPVNTAAFYEAVYVP